MWTYFRCQYAALLEIEQGVANKDVSKKLNVPKNTLSTWKKNRDKIVTAFKSGAGTKRQQVKEGAYEQVNLSCFKWLLIQRSENIPIQWKIIQEKALEFANELNLEKFQASDGWFHSWKVRYNISFKEVSGESKSVSPEMTPAWKETSLPTILSRYELKDIYIADEFCLFYQGLPKKTLQLKGEKYSSGKYNKVRLTGMAAARATGEKLPMFVKLVNQCNRDASNMLKACHAVIVRNQKVGWSVSFLMSE